MTPVEMVKLANILNWHFRESLSGLPAGFVGAASSKGELRLTIGPRTVVIDAQLSVVNAETLIGES